METFSGLTGRVILVTGAGGNVGKIAVGALLAAGARVAGIDHRATSEHAGLLALTSDLTQEAEVEAAFAETERAIGPLWGVLHIAGGWKGGHRVAETNLALFEEMLSINLRTAFLVSRAAMRRFKSSGRIVLVASQSAAASVRLTGSGAYNISKAGVISLTRVLAEEGESRGIYANCVAPGTIATAANRVAMPDADQSKWVTPEEVVHAMLAALSPACSLNGCVLTLRG